MSVTAAKLELPDPRERPPALAGFVTARARPQPDALRNGCPRAGVPSRAGAPRSRPRPRYESGPAMTGVDTRCAGPACARPVTRAGTSRPGRSASRGGLARTARRCRRSRRGATLSASAPARSKRSAEAQRLAAAAADPRPHFDGIRAARPGGGRAPPMSSPAPCRVSRA
jgi:hypothetical protein